MHGVECSALWTVGSESYGRRTTDDGYELRNTLVQFVICMPLEVVYSIAERHNRDNQKRDAHLLYADYGGAGRVAVRGKSPRCPGT